MEFGRNKIILYIIIIASAIEFILPFPMFQPKPSTDPQLQQSVISETRFPRQIVQPTWLNTQLEPFVDPTVHVNERVLQEAELIRKNIQKAVQQGQFAVTEEETNPNIPMVTSPSLTTLTPPLTTFTPTSAPINTPHNLPPWYLQIQRNWQNWSQSLKSRRPRKETV